MRIGWIDAGEEDLFGSLRNHLDGHNGIRFERVRLEALKARAPWDYDVIIDRGSSQIPFYAGALRQAVLDGVRVINDPFWTPTNDSFFALSLARRVGANTPPLVLLPNKDVRGNLPNEAFANLAYPLDWDAVLAEVGLPAWLKPADGSKGKARKVHSREELLEHFDQSGEQTMMLQGDVVADEILRAFTFGPRLIQLSRFDAASRTYPPPRGLDPEVRRKAMGLVRQLERNMALDVNRLEFAVVDGELQVLEASRAHPRFLVEELGQKFRERLIETMAKYICDVGDEVKSGKPSPALSRLIAAAESPRKGSRPRRSGSGRGPDRRSSAREGDASAGS